MSVELGSVLKSTGSLWDSNGNCLPDSVHGTFYNGITAGSDTAYVDVQVNVTATGSYKIESDLQDGFLFSDSGFFTNTGLNTVRLKPLGTPIIPTTATFNISFDSSFCSFTVVINDSTGTGLGGVKDTTGSGTGGDSTVNIANNSWQFIANGHTYSGTFISSILGPSVIGSQLVLTGFPASGSTDTTFSLTVQLPSTTIDTGYYQTTFAGTNFALAITLQVI